MKLICIRIIFEKSSSLGKFYCYCWFFNIFTSNENKEISHDRHEPINISILAGRVKFSVSVVVIISTS